MIPKPYIARWRKHAPWNTNEQVEQDLIISRSLIALFSDEFICENLAFRGGTALHKLYLQPAPRYSEDIDLVQIKSGPIKPILERIHQLIDFFEEERVVKQKINNNTIIHRFTSEHNPGLRLRLKIEINCREHFNLLGWARIPLHISNPWYSDEAMVITYQLPELLATKLRALYQRKKGRDLFDLYHAHQNYDLDYNLILKCFRAYFEHAGERLPSKKQFIQNMQAKRESPMFKGDLRGILRPEISYNQEVAFEWLLNELLTNYN